MDGNYVTMGLLNGNQVERVKVKAGFPFVRTHGKPRIIDKRRSGKTYYVVDACGRKVEIGKSVSRGTNHLVYSSSSKFIKMYERLLPMYGGCSTENLKEFEMWINRQIYYSFQAMATHQSRIRWFVKTWKKSNPELNVTIMPNDYCMKYGDSIPNKWVLFKVGPRVFPVRAENNRLLDELSAFENKLGLEDGFRLVCGIEREWIIDVIVLNRDLEVVHGKCVKSDARLEYIPGVDASVSPFLPSSWTKKEFLCCFGHFYENVSSLSQVLMSKACGSMELIKRPEKISIFAGSRFWVINSTDGGFSIEGLKLFESDANLKPGVFLYFGVIDTCSIWFLGFNEKGTELILSR